VTEAAKAREAGRIEEALALYRRATALRPNWDEGTWYLGTLLYERGRYAEARGAFSALAERQPDHAGAVGMRGLCEFQLQRHEEALRSLLRSRELGIAHTPALASVVRYHAAILLTRFGEFEVASSVLSEPGLDLAENPALIDAFGVNLLRMPLLPSEVPADRRPLVHLAGRAALAMAARRAAIAKQALDELVARYPTTSSVHYARGAFNLTEAPDAAVADFEREIAVDASHLLAHLQLALEWLRRGNVEKARGYAERAVRIDPGSSAARVGLGQVQLEAGDLAAAISELETAVRLSPGSPQTHFVLARAYARAGREADAERERREFTRLDQLAKGKK
jgi:tetratricopeptide (TPR) repeat protein